MAVEKQVNVDLVVSDEGTPKIIELSQAMQKELAKSTGEVARNFKLVTTNSKQSEQQLSKVQKQVALLSSENKVLKKSLDEVGNSSAFEMIESGLSKVSKVALASGAALAGIATIDKLFIPLNETIFRTNEAVLKASFAADKAFSEFASGEGILRRLQETFFSVQKRGLEVVSKGLVSFKQNLTNTRTILQGFQSSMDSATKITKGVTTGFVAAAKHTELFEKGLAATIFRAGLGATAFGVLGSSLIRSDSIMNKMAGVTLLAMAAALGGVVLVAKQFLTVIGDLVSAIGNKLTQASINQVKSFSEAEKTTFAFQQTIASYSESTEEAAVQTANWTAFQEKLTEQTGTTAATMRALIAETISATEHAHLNEQQMKQLISASIDLSERAHKPAIDTLTALINAMNGAGQGVIALGLHINDAAVEHSKLSKEQKEVFKTADDATKAQIRFAVLMEQAGRAAGFASENADLYSKSVKLQKNAIETLNAELGRGAAILNGEYLFGLANVTQAFTNFAKPILPTVGFLQALGGRLLEVSGFFIKNVLSITLMTSSLRALNVLMAKGFAGGVFARDLPFINKSFGRLLKDLGATNIKLDSLKGLAIASLQVLRTQALNGTKALIGLDASAKLTVGTVGTQMVKGLRSAALGFVGMTKSALAFIATPVGATITGIAVGAILLFNALKKVEQETGIFSEVWKDLVETFKEASPAMELLRDVLASIAQSVLKVFAAQVKLVAAGLSALVSGAFRAILAFQELSQFLPESMRASQEAMRKTEDRINKMDAAASKFLTGAASDFLGIFVSSAEAADMNSKAMDAWARQLVSIESKISKFEEKTKKAFESVSEFTPSLNFEKFKKESIKFEQQVVELQGLLEEKKLKLIDAPQQTAEIKAALDATVQKIAETEEVIQGLRIKRAQELRASRVREIEIELQSQLEKVRTVDMEIQQMRMSSARETRDILVEIERNRLLEQRNLLSVDAQEGISIREQAALEANRIQLEAFKRGLAVEKDLALTAEQQKQMEVAQLRAQLLQGTSAGAEAGQDVEVLREQQKFAQLQALREQGLISEQQFQNDLTTMRLQAQMQRNQLEIAQEEQRATSLGLTPEGLQARLEVQRQRDAMELEQLKLQLQQKGLTQEEFNIAANELKVRTETEREQIEQQFIQQEIQRNKSRGESWKATLKEIELAQRQHGTVMGTLQAVQQSAQFQAIQTGLGAASSLMQSERRKEFEIGKKAAIAQTVVNTFTSATAAFASLAGIPIVGPVLATAAAAAAVAAGLMNIRRIKSTKFQGGGAGGGAGAAPPAPTPTQTLGGQADKGLDAVPRSLSGKSFILSAGERVVQPEANQDLTGFLDRVNSGEQGIGDTNVNITVQGNINNREDAVMIGNMVIEELRRRSERGEPIINSKGIVNG